MELLANIERLSAIRGVSGWEDAVRNEILSQLEGKCDYEVDPLGNVIAFKKGRARAKNTVLLSAHMDEVGFIVTYIEDSGLLRFAEVGGIDSRVVIGKQVEVGEGALPGVIGTKPTHLQEEAEREKPLALSKLYIDIGAKDKAEAERHVCPGDRASFRGPFQRLGDRLIMGRAFDDRAGCALLLDLIASDLNYDCAFSFTVQEETGCTGAVTAGYRVKPDIAVAVETTTASDIAGVEPDKTVCALGKGPVVSFMDRGTVYDHALFALALDTAGARGIPCQMKEGVAGGNEARSLQTARAGARSLAISLPCRYLHTPSNVLHLDDIASTRLMLEAALEAFARL